MKSLGTNRARTNSLSMAKMYTLFVVRAGTIEDFALDFLVNIRVFAGHISASHSPQMLISDQSKLSWVSIRISWRQKRCGYLSEILERKIFFGLNACKEIRSPSWMMKKFIVFGSWAIVMDT